MKTRSLLAPVEYVLASDPDVDLEHPDFKPDKYLEDFCDPKWRPIKEGGCPARFKLRPLSRKAMLRAQKSERQDMAYEAAYHSLCGVTNWEHNGVLVSISEGDLQTIDGLSRLSEAWLDKHFDSLVFMELGGAALSLSNLRPTKG